jgi:hypothetical protein
MILNMRDIYCLVFIMQRVTPPISFPVIIQRPPTEAGSSASSVGIPSPFMIFSLNALKLFNILRSILQIHRLDHQDASGQRDLPDILRPCG